MRGGPRPCGYRGVGGGVGGTGAGGAAMAAKWRRSRPEGAVRGCPPLLPAAPHPRVRIHARGGGGGAKWGGSCAAEPCVSSALRGAGGEAPCGAQRRLRAAAPRERCGAAPKLCGALRPEGAPGPSAALRRSAPRSHRPADVHLQAGHAGR